MRYAAKIKLRTYSCVVNIIVTDNILPEIIKIKNKLKLTDEMSYCAGMVMYNDDNNGLYYMILALEYLGHNLIAHELHHLVMGITVQRGIKDEESQAWLAGDLSEHIYKFIDKHDLLTCPIKIPQMLKLTPLVEE